MHIIQQLFFFLNNLKIFHWNTDSYAKHKASDQCFESIQDLSDKFIEIYIGKYGRGKLFHSKSEQISLNVLTSSRVEELLEKFIQYLKSLKLNPKTDSDLLNLIDEMVGVLNQTLYLFTLK